MHSNTPVLFFAVPNKYMDWLNYNREAVVGTTSIVGGIAASTYLTYLYMDRHLKKENQECTNHYQGGVVMLSVFMAIPGVVAGWMASEAIAASASYVASKVTGTQQECYVCVCVCVQPIKHS